MSCPTIRTRIITVAKKHDLLKEKCIGEMTSSQLTGNDFAGPAEKSGVAEIMTMKSTSSKQKKSADQKHGPIAVAFTPDEESGRGIDINPRKGFRARSSLTPGRRRSWEGRSATTPGARAPHSYLQRAENVIRLRQGSMVNAMYALGDYLSRFPRDVAPKTTTAE